MSTKSRLKEVMRLYGDSMAKLAEHLNITYQSLNKKVNNHVDFKRSEIKKIADRYDLDAGQIYYIFFDDDVYMEDTSNGDSEEKEE